MQLTPLTASLSVPATAYEPTRNSQIDDLAYQVMTVAAILLVLGSLWVF